MPRPIAGDPGNRTVTPESRTFNQRVALGALKILFAILGLAAGIWAVTWLLFLLGGCAARQPRAIITAPAKWIEPWQEGDKMLSDEFPYGHWSCPTGYQFIGERSDMGQRGDGRALCFKRYLGIGAPPDCNPKRLSNEPLCTCALPDKFDYNPQTMKCERKP